MDIQQYLKENEAPLLIDTKPEAGETVILTDSRVIHIKNGEVLYARDYKYANKLRFYDSNGILVEDPRCAVAVEVIRTVGRYGRRELRVCYLAGFSKIAGIASALHIRCRTRGYDNYLCSLAKPTNRAVLAVLISAILVVIFGIGFAEKLQLLALLVPITPVGAIIAALYMIKNMNDAEWQYRNELYGIHPDVNSKL